MLALGTLACFALAGLALAEDEVATGAVKPRFVVLPARTTNDATPQTTLPTWRGNFIYGGQKYVYTMVGRAPSKNLTTKIKAIIIPIKLVITSGGTTATYDPETVLSNGKTVVQNTVASPLFDKTTTYTQGGVNVGTTQYIDAYQRANFWGSVSTFTNSHLLLAGPTIMAEQTLSPPKTDGSLVSAFGITAALVNINWFDGIVQGLLTSLAIPANTIPIFLTYNTYLTSGGVAGCCIGGYHSFTGVQAYMEATYVDAVGAFSQNVSALSHELGEWADDPFTNNNSPCGGPLEVGDPLEGEPNYGGFPYTVNGFTYDLQDLVTLPYFGAPTSTSVNGYLSFQGNTSLSVCSNGS
ncbi:MAG TPA: hypothetical protein VKR61_09965 [Bryobacteraceae bacterium]|nr:hypothetical protein [Bryobacteraceae bacterium]